jgi:hypothetical protein
MEPTPITLTFERAAAIHGHGLLDARMARVAARRAFVEMKQCFMRAAAEIDGDEGGELQRQVRQSTEVTELWRLRSALFGALPRDTVPSELRDELRQHLDSAFPEAGPDTGFTPL